MRLVDWFLVLGLVAGLACGQPEVEQTSTAAKPLRIVALAPNLTETLFALGLGDRVVGVGDFSQWPPEAAALPRLGGLIDPQLERIIALKPDLFVGLPSQNDLAQRLERLGIATLLVRSETVADVLAGARVMGARCGIPTGGEALARDLELALAPRNLGAGQRVMLSLGRPPGQPRQTLVAGPDTFLDELLRRLSAENAFDDAPLAYPLVGPEEVLWRHPDIIIELHSESLDPELRERLGRDWATLPWPQGVKPPRVGFIDGDHVLMPGPRLPRLYSELARALEAEP